MPIPGRVNGDARRMTVRINVSGDAGEYREMVFEVDTASDLELALPIRDVLELGLDQAGNADHRSSGTSHEGIRYRAYAEWHDGPIPIHVEATDRPAYVGMGLLWDSYLSAYLFPNGVVEINRMVHWDDLRREADEE